MEIPLPNCPVGGEIKTLLAFLDDAPDAYQIAPWGARSKQHQPSGRLSGQLTKLPRGGRDQNGESGARGRDFVLPNCPVGGEIKTGPTVDQSRTTAYQIAPWGARSKRASIVLDETLRLTKLPRGGRDQNRSPARMAAPKRLPNCPVGGEIKTNARAESPPPGTYQIAPWGARSKLRTVWSGSRSTLTKLPRGGRDQNRLSERIARLETLPNCPVGGEIKTTVQARCWPLFAYQIAPWGARSKHLPALYHHPPELTKLPRGGRDQNTLL